MKYFLIIVFGFFLQSSLAQLTCETLNQTGVTYKGTGHKNGRGRLFNTDTAITNRMKFKDFEMKVAGNLSDEEKAELKKFKINFNPTDTVIFYDWDIMHQGKIGYHGKAVAKIRINCADSMLYTYKYLLKKETTNYVPNRFKIFKMNEKDFIIGDRNHAYLNINVYFKKD